MPDTDPVAAWLDEARSNYEAANAYGGDETVPRLIAALDRVLALADPARATLIDPRDIREAISGALLGEAPAPTASMIRAYLRSKEWALGARTNSGSMWHGPAGQMVNVPFDDAHLLLARRAVEVIAICERRSRDSVAADISAALLGSETASAGEKAL